jgi:hypothetical protein
MQFRKVRTFYISNFEFSQSDLMCFGILLGTLRKYKGLHSYVRKVSQASRMS